MAFHIIYLWLLLVLFMLTFLTELSVARTELSDREFDDLHWFEMGLMDPADISTSNDEAFAETITRGKDAFRGTGKRIGSATTHENQKRKKKDARLEVINVICSNDKFSDLCNLINTTIESDKFTPRTTIDVNLDFSNEFTLFAPTNIAFNKQPLRTIMPQRLTIEDFLNSHIINRAFSFDQLGELCFYQIPTRFDDEPTRTICDLNGTPIFQTGEGNIASDRPRLYGRPFVDIRVRNGFIHAIDDFIKTIQFLETEKPSMKPSKSPSQQPSLSAKPSNPPSHQPSTILSSTPSQLHSIVPSNAPSEQPSMIPSSTPSHQPSMKRSNHPSQHQSMSPSNTPSNQPSTIPSSILSHQPSMKPSNHPSKQPSMSMYPSNYPSQLPNTQINFVPGAISAKIEQEVLRMKPSYTPSVELSTASSLTPDDGPNVRRGFTEEKRRRRRRQRRRRRRNGDGGIPSEPNYRNDVYRYLQ